MPTLTVAELSPEIFQSSLKTDRVFRTIITPEVADLILEQTNTRNRSPKLTRVRNLVRVIKEGHWEYNAQPLTFDVEGRLQDGQHRLMACVASDTALEMLVAFGLSAKAVWGVDRGASRSLNDHFKMKGEQYSQGLASTIQLLNNYESGVRLNSNIRSMSPHTAEEILERHPGLRHAVALVHNQRSPLTNTVMAFLLHIFLAQDQDVAFSFFDAMTDNRKVSPTEPIYEFRRIARQVKDKETFCTRHDLIGFAVQAFDEMVAAKKGKDSSAA